MSHAYHGDWPRLEDVPNARGIYLGSTAQGHVLFDNKRTILEELGNFQKVPLAGLLALGLTECCVNSGWGKVYYIAGYTSWEGRQQGIHATAKPVTPLFQVPNLLYVRHRWDDETRKEWLKLAHRDRLEFLCASGGALHLKTFCMPIGLNISRDGLGNIVTYDGVRLNEGKALAVMHYDLIGDFYLGWLDEMTDGQMILHQPGGGEVEHYSAKKENNLPRYRYTSGKSIVDRLKTMYNEMRQVMTYSSVMRWSVDAHNDWVRGNGYKLEPGDTSTGRAKKPPQ